MRPGVTPPRQTGRWRAVLALTMTVTVTVTIVMLVVRWRSSSRGHDSAAQAAPVRDRQAEPTTPLRAEALRRARVAPWPSTKAGAEGAAAAQPPTQSAVDLYLSQSQYPPTSQPLDRARNPDLIDWNLRSDEVHASASDPGVDFVFGGDTFWLIGDAEITTWLLVRRHGVPTDVRVLGATVTVQAPRGGPLPARAATPIPLQYLWTDGAYVASFRPATLPGLQRSVDLVFEIEFDHGSGRQRARLAAGYTPAAAAPARFTGAYREAVEDGSLVVYAGVEVRDAGWYNVDCNLWDAAEQPVAWTRFKGDLAAGQQEVRLLFFGKVLLDSARAAPWHLGQLRGYRYDAEASPPEQYMQASAARFTTQAVALSQLSPAEWDAPQREQTLDALLADEAVGQLPPIPQESFQRDVP